MIDTASLAEMMHCRDVLSWSDLLFKLARHDEARAEFERAAAMTRNAREQALLLARARECVAAG